MALFSWDGGDSSSEDEGSYRRWMKSVVAGKKKEKSLASRPWGIKRESAENIPRTGNEVIYVPSEDDSDKSL